MEASTVLDWKAQARELRGTGMSERDIAEAVGKSPSSVHEAVKDVTPAESNGNGHAPEYDTDKLARLAGGPVVPTPGQTTIDGGEVTQQPVHVEEIRVDGTAQLGLIDFGGKKPQSATIALRGGSFDLLDGKAFEKGDVVEFSGTAVVNFIGARDKHDPKTGVVVTAKQVHEARITDLTVRGAE